MDLSLTKVLGLVSLSIATIYSSVAHSAAPDDINNQQRAWFDAVDIDANGDYTDNPGNNLAIGTWHDKSGFANHVSNTGTGQPTYSHNSWSTYRHGVVFDGIDDRLRASGDIWAAGAVDRADIFIVATTDNIQRSTLFGSSDGTRNRLSVHTPWSDQRTYFDQGFCCNVPNRISGTIPISLSTAYMWNFIGAPDDRKVVQDGEVFLESTASGIYDANANGRFSLSGTPHNGRVFEAIFYQTTLSNAQRRIIGSYLSAKWDKDLAAGADYLDVYNGDNTGNGDYDFFVGGIGQDNGKQEIGTSQGLTISNDTFLDADGKYLTAGVDYLLSAPPTGTTTADIPSVNYLSRSNRSWYIDTTGTGGLVDLTFDAAQIGIPVNNNKTYGLLYRPGISGDFTEVATTTMSLGQVSFSHLPQDGVYVIGEKRDVVELSLIKTVDNMAPNIGETVTFTLSVSNAGPDNAIDASVTDSVPAGFTNLTLISNPIGSTFSIVGNTVDWSGISVGAGGIANAEFSAEVVQP